MTRQAAFPYVLFAVTYFVLGLLFAAATDHLHVPMAHHMVMARLVALALAAIGLLTAFRFGRVTYRGLLITTCVMFLALALSIFVLLGQHVDLQQLIATLGARAMLVSFGSSVADCIGAPLLALFFMRRLNRRHAIA